MKMESMDLKCTLCCDRTYSSKKELLKHLSNILENITCPICNNKWSSVAHLIEHLTLDDCQPDDTAETLKYTIDADGGNNEIATDNHTTAKEKKVTKTINVYEHVTSEEQAESLPSSSKETVELTNDGSEESKMYAELRKQLLKPSSQTSELKFINEGGITKYVIVTDEDEDVEMEPGVRIVTKQNTDGTISLTTFSEMKMESDAVIASESQEAEESSEEIYSCNTCGVSFTSVLDHIQNYHNDQDVVVEDSIDDAEPLPDEMTSVELVNTMEGPTPEKQAPRRMITETGDIVEAAVYYSSTTEDTKKVKKTNPAQEAVGKGRANSRRLITTESVIKQVEKLGETNGPYHKVVIKEIDVENGEKVKVFNCMSCNIYVSSLDEFKTHPCKTLKYPCPHCPVAYENSKSLCAHMKVHKNRPGSDAVAAPVSFECEVCSTIFLTNKSLKLHKRMHDPVKSRPIEPPVENEKSTEVGVANKFLCSICDKIMPIEYRTIHQNSHKVEKKFNCDICNKKFQSGEYLEMHMNVHRSDKAPINKQDKSLPYTCLYCDRRFARPHEKVKHERIHTGERPHSCEICGKSFRVAYCLTLHMRTHTGARPYACPHCNKRFKAHSVYNHHLMTHSEVRAYKCPYCPKAFKTSVQLAGHKNSHTKPFSCQHCNRPFASLYAVRVHSETHLRQNNLKFACSLCGATYARAFALKDHIKKVHNKEADKADIKPSLEVKWTSPQDEGEGEMAVVTVAKDVPQDEMNDLGVIYTKYSNELIIP